MAAYLGDFAAGQTVRFRWDTVDGTGESETRATDGEVRVYKDGSVAQTIVGVTDTEDFDGLTGVHLCEIATADAFYVAGSDYSVVLAGAEIDGATVNAVLREFSIQNRYSGQMLATLFDGMSSLPDWLRALARKDAADATALAELNDGGGTYSEATDSLEAARDNQQPAATAALGAAHLDHLIQTAGAVDDAAPSASSFVTALTEATDQHYRNHGIVFTSGPLAGQGRRISGYVGATKTVQVSPAFTEAPADENEFVIVSGVVLGADATIFDGMSSLPDWLRALARKDAADATALLELNDGGGAYDEATDSLEAIGLMGPNTLFGENGPLPLVYTVYKPDGVTPLDGVVVQVSADAGGLTRSQKKVSDHLGRVTFYLEAGTYYIWRHHPRFTFTDPDEEEVTA